MGPPPPEPLTILAWNVQNFTTDRRLGPNRKNDVNNARCAFIAEIVKMHGVNLLLLMETGRDVSEMLDNIKKSLGADSDYDPLPTAETHAVPTIKRSYTIKVNFFTRRHVYALRNLTEAFEIKISTQQTVTDRSYRYAWKVWTEIRPSLAELNLDESSPIAQQCWGHLTRSLKELETIAKERDDQDKGGRAEFIAEWLKEAKERPLEICHLVQKLRFDRRYAAAAFAEEDEKKGRQLLALLEILEVILLLDKAEELRKSANQAAQLVSPPQPVIPDFTWTEKLVPRELADRLPFSLFLLAFAGEMKIDLAQKEDSIHESEDPSFIYNALRVFELVDFFGETYGTLAKLNSSQAVAMFDEIDSPAIDRFDVNGTLLPNQQPENELNWRSALRMRFPIRGREDERVLIYLFHTRFSFGVDDLAEAEGRTVAERKISLRCKSVETMAKNVKEKADSRPCLLLGDFNIPAANDKVQPISNLWKVVGDLGFSNYPDNFPATTLKSPGSFLKAPRGATEPVYYNEPYDRVLCMGFDSTRWSITCRELPVEELLSDLKGAFLQAVKDYYAKVLVRISGIVDQIAECIAGAERRRSGPDAIKALKNAKWFKHLKEPSSLAAELETRKKEFDTRLTEASVGDLALTSPNDILKDFLDGLSGPFPPSMYDLPSLLDDIDQLWAQLQALEALGSARKVLAYSKVVSDHIPILVKIALKPQ